MSNHGSSAPPPSSKKASSKKASRTVSPQSTPSKDEHAASGAEEALQRELTLALGDMGLLVPETEAEVRKAEREQALHPVELPAGLQRFAEPKLSRAEPIASPAAAENPSGAPGKVIPIAAARPARSVLRGVAGSALGFALGAAAASVLWYRLDRTPAEQPFEVGGANSELRSPARTDPARTTLDLASACSECCAGSQCGSAKDDLKSCPSGRACVSCSPSDNANAYRIRISALGLNDAGKAWAQQAQVPLEALQVCASIAGRSLGCRSAVEESTDLLEWTSLPVATTASQLVGGLSIKLLNAGSELAAWSSAVAVSPEILCRGVAARLAPTAAANFSGAADNLGRVSVFFDDTTFVELARAQTVRELTQHQGQLQLKGGALSMYETAASGAGRFVLVYGPTDRARAEAARWQLLDQQHEAKLTFGEDHRGRPRPQ